MAITTEKLKKAQIMAKIITLEMKREVINEEIAKLYDEYNK